MNKISLAFLALCTAYADAFVPMGLKTKPFVGRVGRHMAIEELPIEVPYDEEDVRFPSFQVAFNQRWVAHNLQSAYLVKTPEETASALDHALENYPGGVKIRSGGHCYEDFVLNNSTSAVIDVGSMQDWGKHEDRGYYLSSGDTNWGAFNKIFRNFGFVLPGGSCYSVGLGGHISGGGDGIMSRMYGLTVDWVSGFEVVVKPDATKPAEVIYVSEDDDETSPEGKLYWALRGAGAGTMGIITKYYFKDLPRAPKGAIITNLAFNWDKINTGADLKKILDWYVAFAGSDDNWESSGKFPITHSSNGECQMMLHTAYWNETGKDQAKIYHEKMKAELNDLCEISAPTKAIAYHGGYYARPPVPKRKGLKFLRDLVEEAVEETTTDFSFYEATQTMNPSGPNQRGKYKSAYQVKEFPESMCDTFVKWLKTVPEGLEPEEMNQSMVQIDCFGGKINTVDSDATAVPQRHYKVKLQYQTYWQDPENDELHLGWIRDFYNATYAPYGGTPDPRENDMFEGCYYNYPDADLNYVKDENDPEPGVEHALYLYFLDNYKANPRNLKDIKAMWDPNDYFNHDQSFPVDK